MSSFPLDIASRASNLSERIRIVNELSARRVSTLPDATLSSFDLWKTNKLANKLAGQFHREAVSAGTAEKFSSEDLVNILTTHRLVELNLDCLENAEKTFFAEVHHTWLSTYHNSLQNFAPSHSEVSEASWYKPEIYYGKFAKVCEPFLMQIQRELLPICVRVNAAAGMELFALQLIEDMQNNLLHRFALSLAWATEVEANIYCARNKIDKTCATTDDYIAFLDATFSSSEAYHRFYLCFPVLGRWLAQITRFLTDNGRMLIERLHADIAEISRAFFGKKITRISSFKSGKSDYHAGGQCVVLVEVELEASEQATFVYKPRCLRIEVALQGMLDRLSRASKFHFAPYRILAKDDYGYAAFIPSGRNHLQSSSEVKNVYEELGGYLGLFYILGGSDMHFENLLIADGHAFVCDGETVLGVLPYGQEQPLDTVLDSVYKTGLLEWPRMPTDDTIAAMRVSGYAGGEPFQIPIAQPKINDRRMSFALSVKHEEGISIHPDATNRVYLADRLTRPEEFKDSILNGFNRVHEWFQQEAPEAIQCIFDLFGDTTLRFVSRATQIYTQLLISAQHPQCLMEPLEVDFIMNSLREHPRKWDQSGLMAECELSSLWQLDIPIFTVSVQKRELVHDRRTTLPTTLQVTPLEFAAQRIRRLSPQNRLQQIQYITASLSSNEVQSPSFIASALDYAQQIGWQLCKLLRAPSEQVPWKSYQLTHQGTCEIDIQADLYNGSAGIALFLAYLDSIAPQPQFRQAAQRALLYSINYHDRKNIGAFQGQAGLIYLLTHLYHLWEDPQLLDQAIDLSRELVSEISNDREFDIFNGAAGVIPVMIGLAETTTEVGLDCAHRCAEHLLQYAERGGNGYSWPLIRPQEAAANLTGFSHGAGGIGWALISLGCLANQSDYIAAGRAAFAYEASHFDADEQDWYDLRTRARGIVINQHGHHFANAWCNGAAGIGLSRITSWAMLGKNDDELLKEAYLALRTTLHNFHKLGNDTLCHGKAGNAELFLRFALLKKEPAFRMEANVQAQAQWKNFEKARYWTSGAAATNVFPGLMLGLSGFGMHFLRLAYPEQIPSPLLLDPPQKT